MAVLSLQIPCGRLGRVTMAELLFASLGFLPIGCLSAALMGLAPLHLTAKLVVLPMTALAIAIGWSNPAMGRRALRGWWAGVVAVALYDVVRLTCVSQGWMRDFIPAIGPLALDDPDASWVWGYLWRYVYNGGAMGVAFAMLPVRGRLVGLLFGSFVCSCLLLTLILQPRAQELFFSVRSPSSVAIAWIGHWVYGYVLGAQMEERRSQARTTATSQTASGVAATWQPPVTSPFSAVSGASRWASGAAHDVHWVGRLVNQSARASETSGVPR